MRKLRFGIVYTFLICTLLPLAYQNCGEAFKPLALNSLTDTREQIPQSKILDYQNFTNCHQAGGAANIAACLSAMSVDIPSNTQQIVNQCVGAGSMTAFDLALCMSKNGVVVKNHREPMQSDFVACSQAAGGLAAMAVCLDERGVLTAGISQVVIDDCLTASALGGLEKCLRGKNLLKKVSALSQHDVDYCVKIDGADNLGACLANRDAAVAASALAACTTNGTSGVVKCLRTNGVLSKALLQAHIYACNIASGSQNIASCLEANGVLENAIAQSEIDSCVSSTGIDMVAKCLRGKKLLPDMVMQYHIDACHEVVGQAGISSCLEKNGLVSGSLSTGVVLNQSEIDSCISMATLAGVRKCLTSKKILVDSPTQASIDACHTVYGDSAIATCLDNNGLLLAGVTQAQFDTCIANVGLANSLQCMITNGYIGSFQKLNATGGVFATHCSNCHGGSGGLTLDNHAQVLLRVSSGNPNGSLLYNRITANNAGTVMPPTGKIPAAEAEKVRVWILQGAKNN